MTTEAKKPILCGTYNPERQKKRLAEIISLGLFPIFGDRPNPYIGKKVEVLSIDHETGSCTLQIN